MCRVTFRERASAETSSTQKVVTTKMLSVLEKMPAQKVQRVCVPYVAEIPEEGRLQVGTVAGQQYWGIWAPPVLSHRSPRGLTLPVCGYMALLSWKSFLRLRKPFSGGAGTCPQVSLIRAGSQSRQPLAGVEGYTGPPHWPPPGRSYC